MNADDILHRLRTVLHDAGRVALHEPHLEGRALEYVQECIETGWVSSVGKFVDRFEDDLAACTGARRAVVVVNGTAALQMCLLLAGVTEGDEVLCPALTFVATANAIAHARAVPHFVDCEERTLGLDPHKLADYLNEIAETRYGTTFNRRTGRPLRAVVAMHTFGHPVDLDPLVEVCERFRITLVEDAAESLGSRYKGRHTGTFGRVAAVSFNGNKIITTGGGGAILTNDDALADRAKHLTTTAKLPHRWEFVHDEIGYNFRMPNLNAALGCAQLELLPMLLERKRALAQQYQQAFADCPDVRVFREPEFATSNYWLNALVLPETAGLRDEVLERTNDAGVMTRPVWRLLSRLPIYSHCPAMDLSVSERLERQIVNIPSSAKLAAIQPAKTSARRVA